MTVSAGDALRLLETGFAVLPLHGIVEGGQCTCRRSDCPSAGKHPRTKHGHLDASSEPEQVRLWWGTDPEANVGVRTGGGLAVLDVDPRNGGAETLQALVAQHGKFETWTVRTGGGGWHFYLRTESELPSRAGLFTGIDFKAKGGFVVAPPSVHASGRIYRWLAGRGPADVSLAELPGWLREAVQRPRRGSEGGAQMIEKGQRNKHLASIAGAARRKGADGKALLELLLAENAKQCRPPLEHREVEGIAASIGRYPTGAASKVDDALKQSGVHTLTSDSALRDCEPVLRRLAILASDLDPVEQALVRAAIARLRVLPARAVDMALKVSAAARASEPALEGRSLMLEDHLPWHEPVHGAALLDELAAVFRRHVILPEHTAEAMSLWVLHTHALAAAEITPRLAILSPEKRCGKTTVLKLLGALVRRPLPTTNVSSSAVFRTIEKFEPTLLVDEADTFLAEREELRGVLNTGHDRQGGQVIRCVGENLEPRIFRTWAPVAIAAIGSIHETLRDRSIVVPMKRRSIAEEVASLRKRNVQALSPLPRKCARWVRDHRTELEGRDVLPPRGLGDRAVDNWEALFAIADVAGGAWPARARAAAVALSGSSDGESDSRGQFLLADVRALFGRFGDRVTGKLLLAALNALEERPWGELNGGKGLTAYQLARMLGRFQVRSRTIRVEKGTARGFLRFDFADAFARYLPPQAVTVVTPLTTAEDKPTCAAGEVSPKAVVTDLEERGSSEKAAGVSTVTDPSAESTAASETSSEDLGDSARTSHRLRLDS